LGLFSKEEPGFKLKCGLSKTAVPHLFDPAVWALELKMYEHFGDKFGVFSEQNFCIELDTGENYHIEYETLKKWLTGQSVHAVFQQICAEYETVNRQRSECRRILFAHMASLGYILDEDDDGYFFGRNRRKYLFDPEKDLTGDDVLQDLVFWLRKQNLPEDIDIEASAPIKRPPLPHIAPQSIPMLETYDFSAIDTKARKILEQYRCEGHEFPHERWESPLWFHPEKDLWMDYEWWHEQARIHKDDLLLAVLGDGEAHKRIVRDMQKLAEFGWSASFSIYEGYCPLKAFMARDYAWPHEDPVAFYRGDDCNSPEEHYWLMLFDSIPYEIKQYAQGMICDSLKDYEDEDQLRNIELSLRVFTIYEIGQFFSMDELYQIYKICSNIAAMYFGGDYNIKNTFLKIAYKFRWIDILDTLSCNESFWQLWKSWPFNFTYSGDFALALSLFDKNELTQRFAAWILSIDEKTIPKEILETFNLTSPKKILEDQQLPAALAWSRTRLLF